MNPEEWHISVRRRLRRTMVLLVLGTVLLLSVSGFFLLLAPSLESVARARISQLSAAVEARLQRLALNTDRQLKIAGRWLAGGSLSLDHSTLNRRFMPILTQYPEYSAMLVADRTGNEWMLYKKSDGTWLNRLTNPGSTDGSHRFLHWQDSQTLKREETKSSDYNPLQRPWFRKAMLTPRDQTAWTDIYRFFTAKKPGITASMRIAAADGNSDLILGLDLLLDDVAEYLGNVRIGQKGLAVLLNTEGRLLGVTALTGGGKPAPLENLVFQPVTEVALGPLQQGLGVWQSRFARPSQDRLIWHDWELWYVGYRKLELGKRDLWLGVHLPVSELIPGLYPQLLVLAAVLLLAFGGVLILVAGTARSFSRPLEQLADNSRRIGDLDFSAPVPIDSQVREIAQLAWAQDEMRQLLASAHDELVTKQRELQATQARLIQAAKLESVGRLAAGMAHEVKNPLAVMQMGVEFLQGETKDTETHEVLHDMDDAVQRADRVIKGLLDFSRDKKLDLKSGDINEIIRSSLHMVGHELKQRGIRVEMQLNTNLPPIPLDADKLRQVLINLALNAAQAMGGDGTLSVSSDLRQLTENSGLERDHAHRFHSGETALWVEMADTGPGIDEQQLQRIFDPFFTTKGIGEGTGLGLSVSRNIVELHRGCIDIRNRAEGGASAVLLFNLATGAPDEEKDPAGG